MAERIKGASIISAQDFVPNSHIQRRHRAIEERRLGPTMNEAKFDSVQKSFSSKMIHHRNSDDCFENLANEEVRLIRPFLSVGVAGGFFSKDGEDLNEIANVENS